MKFYLLTLFPEYFEGILKSSILGRALQPQGSADPKLSVEFIALREFGEGRYRAVDDSPYGGGEGMVLMAPVLEAAIQSILKEGQTIDALARSVASYKSSGSAFPELQELQDDQLPYVLALSPQGTLLSPQWAKNLVDRFGKGSGARPIVLVCGHYEGFDERFLETLVHEEVSIGDYVLTGGEPAAAVLLDVVARFIPGVVGKGEVASSGIAPSVVNDTFEDAQSGGLKYPQYTRPLTWRDSTVPAILSSGNHGKIAEWRKVQSVKRTAERRPELQKGKGTAK